MADRVARIILLPRYTALYGTVPFNGAPVNVRRFGSGLVTAWRSTGLGTSGAQASVVFKLQQSTDLGIWNNVGATISPGAELEASEAVTLDLEWIRIVATVSGTKPGVTCWAIGTFVAREGVLGGL